MATISTNVVLCQDIDDALAAKKGIILNKLKILWWTLFFMAIFFQMCTIPLYSWNLAPPQP